MTFAFVEEFLFEVDLFDNADDDDEDEEHEEDEEDEDEDEDDDDDEDEDNDRFRVGDLFSMLIGDNDG